MKEKNRIVLGTIFGGLFLSFVVQVLSNWLKPYTDNIFRGIDMTQPFNFSLLFVIPVGAMSAIATALVVFWFLKRDDYFSTALGFSLCGLVIDISRATGGILYYLLMGSRGSFVWLGASFLLLYATVFLSMIIILNIIDKTRGLIVRN